MIEIIEIKQGKKHPDRYHLYGEEGFLLSVCDEVLYRNHIQKGALLKEEMLEALRLEDTFQFAKSLAADYLGRGMKTEKQLQDYLSRHGIDAVSIEKTVALMREYGYINDAEYARLFAKQECKKWGGRVIFEKMRQKGIAPDLAKEQLQAVADQEETVALVWAEKLQKRYAKEPAMKQRQKIYAALMRKGFSGETISTVLSKRNELDDEEFF